MRFCAVYQIDNRGRIEQENQTAIDWFGSQIGHSLETVFGVESGRCKLVADVLDPRVFELVVEESRAYLLDQTPYNSLLRKVNHNLRNQLNTIQGVAFLLKRKIQKDPSLSKIGDYLETNRTMCAELIEIVEQEILR